MKSLFKVLFSVLVLFSAISARGQQFYPVQVRPTVNTASVFLEDYQDPVNFSVQVRLNDVTVPSYNLNLHIKIKKGDIEITSIRGIDITVAGGQTYMLGRGDLQELLDNDNLNFSGINFESGSMRTLPEGAYHISFTAYHANTNVPVSNAATDFTQAVVVQNDPPLLNLPQNGALLDLATTGQNITFSWTPRSFISSPGQRVKYRIQMIRVVPVDRNPYEAMNSGAFDIENDPFNNIEHPVFLYDQTLYPLEEGGVYAWRVEAYEERLVNGKIEESSKRFKNGGVSEVYTFSVKENCTQIVPDKPAEITSPEGKPLIALDWNNDETHNSYEIKYRPSGSVLPWTILNQEDNHLELGSYELETGKDYEYTLAVQCKNWQPAVYGGTFRLRATECEAPAPILIASNDEEGIKLEWGEKDPADRYQISYQYNPPDQTEGAAEAALTETVEDPAFTLPHKTEGNYTVKIDALCGNLTGEGEENVVNFDDEVFVGDCPLPEPLKFIVTQAGDTALDFNVQATWAYLPIHEEYELIYHHRDSSNAVRTFAATEPHLQNFPVEENQLYKYELKYTCQGGKSVVTPPGYFRLEGGEDTTVNITPGTANCFPPSSTIAEVKNTTTARFEWSKVDDADEYQLFYSPHNDNNFELFATTSKSAKLKDLVEKGEYDYKIRCRCGADYSIFSDVGYLDLGLDNSGECDSVPNFNVVKTTTSEVQLTWAFEENRSGYKIFYKENSQSWDEQYIENLNNIADLEENNLSGDSIKYTIINLDDGVTYQFKIQGQCASGPAVINDPVSATTVSKEVDEGDCVNPNACDRSSKEPIEELKVEDTIYVADYKLVIEKLESAGENIWKGTGVAEAPFIGLSENVRLNASFDSLFVNDKECVVDGLVNIDSASVYILNESIRNEIKDNVDFVDQLGDRLGGIAGNVGDGLETGENYGKEGIDYFQGGGSTGQVKTGSLSPQVSVTENLNESDINVNSEGKIVINEVVYEDALPALIEDNDGTVFSVDSEGNVVTVGQGNEGLAGLDTVEVDQSEYAVTFVENSNAVYAFDEYQSRYGEKPAMASHYLKIGDDYFSAKAIVPSAVDYVDFEVSGGLNRQDIKFVNREGFEYTVSGNTVTLAGGPAKDAQEVFAVYINEEDTTVVGALLLASYPVKTKKVIIIPVLTAEGLDDKAEEMAARLNEVYEPVGVHYEIEIDTSFKSNRSWCTSANCEFEPSGSAMLSNDYTGHEKAVIEAYLESNQDLDEEAAYIFAVEAPIANSGDEQLQGKMNFGKQFGFLYNVEAETSSELGKTLAHELGHGNYMLYHIFDEMYMGEDVKYTSENLMGYKSSESAIALNKVQWDVVHEPGVTWGIFARDGDQELSVGYWLDPAGNPFYLNENYKGVVSSSKVLSGEHVNGLVYEWKTPEGVVWKARIEDEKFYGFYKYEKGEFFGDPYPYPDLKEGELLSAYLLKYNFNCTSDYIYKNFNILRDSPSVEEVQEGLNLLSYIDISLPYSVFKANQPVNGCDYSSGELINYVVSNSNAIIRTKTPPYSGIGATLEKGREVKLVESLTPTRYLVKYTNNDTEYCTSSDNLTPMYTYNDGKKYTISNSTRVLVMAYSSIEVAGFSKSKEYYRNKICGKYSLIKDQNGNEGWVLNTDLNAVLPFSIMSNGNPVQLYSYSYISTESEMPTLTIKNNKDIAQTIKVKLRIRYERNSRRDIAVFPEDSWREIPQESEWSLDYGTITDNGITRPLIRGGLAEVIYRVEENANPDTLQFSIRGHNPTEELVHAYMTNRSFTEWYFIKIFRHESGSHEENQIRQFNVQGKLGIKWNESLHCPNWGYPHGYGIGQLDKLDENYGEFIESIARWCAPSQALWDWKFNIATAVGFFRDEKLAVAEGRWEDYQQTAQEWNLTHPEDLVSNNAYINTSPDLSEVGTWVSSVSYSDDNTTYEFAVNPTGSQISFGLANAIKYYNGGYYCVLVTSSNGKPYWRINKLNTLDPPFDYMERICTGTGWINEY